MCLVWIPKSVVQITIGGTALTVARQKNNPELIALAQLVS
jgi:hypothetical protein